MGAEEHIKKLNERDARRRKNTGGLLSMEKNKWVLENMDKRYATTISEVEQKYGPS